MAYLLHGIRVDCPFELPAETTEGVADVVFSLGEARANEAAPAGTVLFTIPGRERPWVTIARDDDLVTVRYHGQTDAVFQGPQSVLVRPDPHLDLEILPLLTIGGILASWIELHARGLVLHASAVQHGASVVAFAGPSGSGKSTLAASAVLDGHRVVTDDALRVEIKGSDAWCHRGTTHLRLRPGAEHLAAKLPDGGSARSADGRLVLTAPMVGSDPLPLGRVIVPGLGSSTRVSVRRLHGSAAIAALARCARVPWHEPTLRQRQFAQLSALARTVDVVAAELPVDCVVSDITAELLDRAVALPR